MPPCFVPTPTLTPVAAVYSGQPSPTCFALDLEVAETRPMAKGSAWVVYRATARDVLLPGGYDLVLMDEQSAVQRSPHSVWLRADDPERIDRPRIAHLSDLHVGKGNSRHAGQILERLFAIVTEVNQLKPDLVVVTGDLVDRGQTEGTSVRGPAGTPPRQRAGAGGHGEP
jgi:hypothetical protein